MDKSAAEILAVIKEGKYFADGRWVEFATQQNQAVAATLLYRPDDLKRLPSSKRALDDIAVVDATTQSMVWDLAKANSAKLGLLNFASARNPGGGFLNGAKAQEEDLCRCSGLYPCLLQCPEYYEVNRQQSSLLYTDYAIFSPDVPFFRVAGNHSFLGEPFFASIITAPAPNSAPFLRDNPSGSRDLELVFLRRWRNILKIAIDQGISRLVLGAWGCGAFGGDPQLASQTAKIAIQEDGGEIDLIVFAIPGKGKQSKWNYDCFKATFESK